MITNKSTFYSSGQAATKDNATSGSGLNFINILRMNFLHESASHSFSLVKFWLCNFLAQK